MPKIQRKPRQRAALTPDDLTIAELLALRVGWSPTLNTRWKTIDEVREAWEVLRPHYGPPAPGRSMFRVYDGSWASREFDQ